MFQTAIDEEFSHEYLMNDLYQADISLFFSEVNSKIKNSFLITEKVEFAIQNTEKIDQMNSLDKEELLRKEVEDLENVRFGNLLQCIFNENGEIVGFKIRPNLINLMHLSSDFNYQYLKRIIKTLCFMNRLIKDGKN